MRTTNHSQDKRSEQLYYDRLFSTRRRFDQFQQAIYERIAQEARQGTEGTRALDIGCGSGVQSLCLIDHGFSVVALDLSIEAAKLARDTVAESGRSLMVVNADAESLPLPDASIDACVCGLLLHHFKSLEAVAAELQRVIRPGGAVVALDANAHNPFAWLFFNLVHRLHPLSGLTPNQRALWRGEIRRVFGAHGFGEFRFASISSTLRRDWLGGSLGATLNFYTRAAVLGFSQVALPTICHGNMLLSVFRRLSDARPASTIGG